MQPRALSVQDHGFLSHIPHDEITAIGRVAKIFADNLLSDRSLFKAVVISASAAQEAETSIVFATHLHRYLQLLDATLAEEFRQCVAVSASTSFITFWKDFLKTGVFSEKESRNHCAFVGGLVAFEIIGYNQFKELAFFILRKFRTRSALRGLTNLIRWATSTIYFVKEPAFLTLCRSMLRSRSQRYLGSSTAMCMEEVYLSKVLNELLLREDCILFGTELISSSRLTSRDTPWLIRPSNLSGARTSVPSTLLSRTAAIDTAESTGLIAVDVHPKKRRYYRTPAYMVSPSAEELEREFSTSFVFS